LNHIVNACIIVVVDLVRLDLKENMFGVGASIEEISGTLVRKKLFLFKRFSIPHLHVQIH
jgi:hypothetical protein